MDAPPASSKRPIPVREQVIGPFASFILKRAVLFLIGFGVLAVAAGALVPSIKVKTSRHALVSKDNPYQAKVFRFFERFGYPDTPLLVVSGSTAESRRKFVDEFAKRLDAEPGLKGRVLARIGADEIAETLLLQDPKLLTSTGVRGDALKSMVESGLPGAFRVLADRTARERESENAKLAEAGKGLDGLALAAKLLEDALGAPDPAEHLLRQIKPPKKQDGVDADGYLTAHDGELHVVAVFPQLESSEDEAVRPLVTRMREIRDETSKDIGDPELSSALTGLPALGVDELVIVRRGLFTSAAVSSAGIFVLLLIMFRNFRYVIFTLGSMGVGVVLTLGVVKLTYGELNLITSSFVSVLLGLGDFGVYVLSHFSECRKAGEDAPKSLKLSLIEAGPGILTGAATTALAFLTTTTIDFTAFAELGVISSIGIGTVVLTTFILLPCMVHVFGRKNLPAAPDPPGSHYLPGLIRKGRHAILAIALAATVASIVALPRLGFNGRYFNFLPKNTESAIGLRQLEGDPVASPVFANLTAESVEEARERTAKLRELSSVAGVQSATDLLPQLTTDRVEALRELTSGARPDFEGLGQRSSSAADLEKAITQLLDELDEVAFMLGSKTDAAGSGAGDAAAAVERAKAALRSLRDKVKALPNDGKDAIGSLERRFANLLGRAYDTASTVAKRGHYEPVDLPGLFQARFASKDGKALAIYAFPKGDIWEAETSRQFGADCASVDPEANGLAITIYQHEKIIEEGFLKSSLAALALVFAVLMVGFRSVKDTFLALIPIGLGCIWSLGAMCWLGLEYNHANVVSLPLLLGISVDAGAHMVYRYRQSEEVHGVPRLDDLLSTGTAVILVFATTVVGFAALMVADYGAMKNFGLIMTIGISGTIISSVAVLPALLVVFKRVQ